MLNPNKNRLNYGNILYAPVNYKLDFAIGTTYSLDLNALIGSTLSLCSSQQTDSSLVDDQIFLLGALRNAMNKVSLFCEKGNIHYPNNPNELYIFLEDLVFQVDNPKQKYSFHPKFWLLRFVNEKDKNDVLYRLIVLSRNLTFDRSWDVTFIMEGRKTKKKIYKNKSISEFLKYLLTYSTNDKKTEKIESIIKNDLDYVKFKLKSEIFDDFDFIVDGIDNKEYSIQNYPLFNDNSDELFIMSPFLNKNVIKGFNNRKNKNSKAILISRESSLGQLTSSDCDNFEVYTLKDEITGAEAIVSEEFQETLNQDIHAKIYLMEKDDTCDLYLGSLNSSKYALNGNVECMIKLTAKRDNFNMDRLVEDIFNGGKDNPNCPFKLVNVDDIEGGSSEQSKEVLDSILKKILELDFNASVLHNDDEFDIELNVDGYDETEFNDFNIQIKPLLGSNYKKLSYNVIFEKLPKKFLSKFFVLKIFGEKNNLKRIIKVPVSEMPDDRENAILSSIINKKNFIDYVDLLLCGDNIIEYIKSGSSSGRDGFKKHNIFESPELYEKMLKTAHSSPEIIKNLDSLFETFSDKEVIPEGFIELYNTFLKVLD